MRRKNYTVAGDELTTVSGTRGIGDITRELTGDVEQASENGRKTFNQQMRDSFRALPQLW